MTEKLGGEILTNGSFRRDTAGWSCGGMPTIQIGIKGTASQPDIQKIKVIDLSTGAAARRDSGSRETDEGWLAGGCW